MAKEKSTHEAMMERETKAAESLVCVEFLTSNAPFNAGETAGFPPDEADRLVRGKKALYKADAIKAEKANAVAQEKADAKADKTVEARSAQIAAALAKPVKPAPKKGAR